MMKVVDHLLWRSGMKFQESKWYPNASGFHRPYIGTGGVTCCHVVATWDQHAASIVQYHNLTFSTGQTFKYPEMG